MTQFTKAPRTTTMLKLNRQQQRLPIGGHHLFTSGRMFKATSFDGLVTAIRDYRIDNNHPIGDPEQEILAFYNRNFPYMVEHDPEAEERHLNEDYVSMREWVFKTWRNAPKRLLGTKEVDLRWAVCAECPFNTEIIPDDEAENIRLVRQLFLLRKGATVPNNLKFCSCHRADLGVFTLIEAAKEFSAKKDGTEQPASCWVS